MIPTNVGEKHAGTHDDDDVLCMCYTEVVTMRVRHVRASDFARNAQRLCPDAFRENDFRFLFLVFRV